MSRRGWLLSALAAVAAAQLLVPLSMIWKRERVLAHGERYRFRAAPVDPADAFRGRYVALSFDATEAPRPEGQIELERWQRLYATLGRDAEGFATVRQVSLEPPEEGDHLAVRYLGDAPTGVRLELPFDRYYLEEELGPEADRAYRQLSRGEKRAVWAEVRVGGGLGVIEELVFDGLPLGDYLERSSEGSSGSRDPPE